MFETYEQALHWIHSRLRLGMKPGLLRMEWMMNRLNHPERNLRAIHVGGTNGKGSTVTFLRMILQEAGYKVGTFTSPYIEQFNERISINGRPIEDRELIELANVIFPLAEELETTELGGPTEFEIITAMAIYYFSKTNPVDAVIFEVGLGGRHDSTNVIHPLLSVITNIGLDHTNLLGSTHEEIAMEKAGIIKRGVPLLSSIQHPGALLQVRVMAQNRNAPFFQLGEHFFIPDSRSLENGERFSVSTLFQQYPNLEINMIGSHQTENAALAVMAAQCLRQYYSFLVEETDIRNGLKAAFWPGRFEVISKDPVIVLDGAHNEEGVHALVQVLGKRYPDKKVTVIFAALKDKKLDKMIYSLDQAADKLIFAEFDFPRAASAADLFELSVSSNKHLSFDWKKTIKEELPLKTHDDVLLITGSLYFISEVKQFFIKFSKNN